MPLDDGKNLIEDIDGEGQRGTAVETNLAHDQCPLHGLLESLHDE